MNQTNTIFYEKASVLKDLNSLPASVEYLFIDILKIDDYFNLPILNLKEIHISICKFGGVFKNTQREHKYPYLGKKENLTIFKVPYGCKIEFQKPFFITDKFGEADLPRHKLYHPVYYKKFIHINDTAHLDKFLSKEFYKNYAMHRRYVKGHFVQFSKYGLYYKDYPPFEYTSEYYKSEQQL